MSLATDWIRYGASREHLAFAAWPSRAEKPLPSVVVIQEIWGVDAHIEDVARRIAQAGYFAFAPDLFAREGDRPPELTRERIAEVQDLMNRLPPASSGAMFRDPVAREAELKNHPEDKRARLSESMAKLFAGVGGGGMELPPHLPPLLAATTALRGELTQTRGRKVAAVGFCMGGGLAALLACHDRGLAAAAVFYGAAPPEGLIHGIPCPVVGFYGSLDKRITSAVPSLEEAMRREGKSFEAHVYEGAAHAFFNDTRPSYHVDAARDAFVVLLELLQRTLAPKP